MADDEVVQPLESRTVLCVSIWDAVLPICKGHLVDSIIHSIKQYQRYNVNSRKYAVRVPSQFVGFDLSRGHLPPSDVVIVGRSCRVDENFVGRTLSERIYVCLLS